MPVDDADQERSDLNTLVQDDERGPARHHRFLRASIRLCGIRGRIQLTKAGITSQDPYVALAAAKKACELMEQGNPQAGVINSVSSGNPGVTAERRLPVHHDRGEHLLSFDTWANGSRRPRQLSSRLSIDIPIFTPGAG